MICPACGNDVPESKFCENCGSPLVGAVAQAEDPVSPGTASSGAPDNLFASEDRASAQDEAFEPALAGSGARQPDEIQPLFSAQQPTAQESLEAQQAPAQGPFDAQQAPAQGPFEAQQAPAMQSVAAQQPPAQGPFDAQQPPAQGPFDAQQPSSQGPFEGQQPFTATGYVGSPAANAVPAAPVAPSAAFVLVIVGLVLSVLGVTFVPGLVCSIIGLVLNSKYSKQGMDNPRKTPTTVLGVIGIVIAGLVLVSLIAFGALFSQVYTILEENGFDADRIEVAVDERTGEITITEKPTAQSQGLPGSKNTSSNAAPVASSDSSYFTEGDDITFALFLENDGAKMAQILGDNGYSWSNTMDAFDSDRPDNVFWVCDPDYDDLAESQIKALPVGGKGEAVIYRYWAEGYSDAESGLKAVANVTVEKQKVSEDDYVYAIVKNSAGERYLVEAYYDGSDCDFAIYTNEAIVQQEVFTSVDEMYELM